MKTVYKEKIGKYYVVKSVENASVDPEKTKAKIAPLIKAGMAENDIKRLYMENLVYAKTGNDVELVVDEAGEEIRIKLEKTGENKLLLADGTYISDFRNKDYWLKNKKSGKWTKEQIDEIGNELPQEAVLPDSLTNAQQEEINAQQEIDRIAALEPEMKKAEKESKLRSLAREAYMKAEEAGLLEEAFDKKAWFLPKKKEIEKLYA